MNVQINQMVKTPIGVGRVVGLLTVLDMNGTDVSHGVAVRLPIDEVTRKELKKDYCITPRAVKSGVWNFTESQLEAA